MKRIKALIKKNKSFCFLAAAMLFVIALTYFVVQPVTVAGESMENTLRSGDFVLVWKLNYRPEKGDVVMASTAKSQRERIIKRVVAVEGDVVLIENNSLKVNGELVHEPYIKETNWRGGGSFTIPKNMCFLMGDNRNRSTDSRDWGFVDLKDIQGKVICTVYSPGK